MSMYNYPDFILMVIPQTVIVKCTGLQDFNQQFSVWTCREKNVRSMHPKTVCLAGRQLFLLLVFF